MRKPSVLACLALVLLSRGLEANDPAGRAVVPARPPSPRELVALDAARREGKLLLLHGTVFDPTRERPDFGPLGLSSSGEGDYGIVQFAPGLLDGRALLQRKGVRFFGYLPDNAFQVRLTPETRALLAAEPSVRWLGEWAPGFKVHRRLWPGSADAAKELTLVAFPDAPLEALVLELRRTFPAVRELLVVSDPVAPRVRLFVPRGQRDALVLHASHLSGVAWMEPFDEPRPTNNNDTLAPLQSNLVTTVTAGSCSTCSIFNHGLNGTGQIVAVADTGLDSDMCFFRNLNGVTAVTDASNTVPPALGPTFPTRKIFAYWVQPGATAYDPPFIFHGTHTSGTAVGDNLLTPSTPGFAGIDVADGMAPNAQLLFQDLGNDSGALAGLTNAYATFEQALDGGARLHSNSYGGDTSGAYTSDDQTADRFLFDHEAMAIFVAAGNSGPSASTLLSPGNAKNVVTVGALSSNTTSIAGFSSRGPTADGRIKPDVVAPGTSIVSAGSDGVHGNASCDLYSNTGTSMACPAVAGATALLRQYFTDGFYPTGAPNAADAFSPSASLMKAVLLNGTLALPASGSFGNGDYGWGRPFLDSNLAFAGDSRKLRVVSLLNTQGLVTGQSAATAVTVAAGQELRATLVWSDAEGTLGAATALVNDLNLTVSDGTTTYRGNVFDGSGVSIPGGSADVRNTVEQVRFVAPAAGSYTITVTAASVPGNGRDATARQGYALAVSFAGCASAVATAPSALTAQSDGVMGVNLSWVGAANASVTQVYRADGSCALPASSFQFVGSSGGTSFTDTRAQGGAPYAYRLRGADACGEGPSSSCVSITPTGRCDVVPTFAGVSTVQADGTGCRILLSWPAAAPNCAAGSPVRYNIYRSLTPGFVPSPGNFLTSVSGTSYGDQNPSVAAGSTYYYVVRAEDSAPGGSGPHAGNEESNGVASFATASGPPGPLGTWTDDGGDTGAAMSAEFPWRVTAALAQAGPRSYHCGPDAGSYSSNICASLTTPLLSLGSGSTLTYFVNYNIEDEWDGVVVAISTDGGATWADLPPTTPSGYPGTFAQTGNPPLNACAFDEAQGAFTGPFGNGTLTGWSQIATQLSPLYDNKNVRIRWRFSSDAGAEFRGFFLDSVAITNVNVPGPCVPLTTPPPASFYPLAPCRVVDTRGPAAPAGGPALAAGGSRAFPLGGQCAVPADAVAAALNITTVSPTAEGDLKLFATGTAAPTASTINFAPGKTRANNAIVGLGTAGMVTVQAEMPAGSTDIVIDVVGYFR
ncbi:MAG: S8 family serine peptidase [Thermoanaerobaculia bacterium]